MWITPLTLPHPTIHPHPPPLSNNANLQNLLILTAIKADRAKVKDLINRLDNFDGPAVAEKAIEFTLFEEAFEIYKKFSKKVEAIKVGTHLGPD